MMLCVGIDVISFLPHPLQQAVDVWEQTIFFVFHMFPYFSCICIVKIHYQFVHPAVRIKRIGQLFSHERQLEIQIIFMVGLKVMQQRADIDIFEFFVPEIAIDHKIDYNEESSAVYAVVFADLFHRLVAKT